MPTTYQHRVTKFDPANRKGAGHYMADEWHLHSQIGMCGDGFAIVSGI